MEKKRQSHEPIRRKKKFPTGCFATRILVLTLLLSLSSGIAGCSFPSVPGIGTDSSSLWEENSPEQSGTDAENTSGQADSAEESAAEANDGASLDQQMAAEGVLPGCGLYGAASQETGYYGYNLLGDAEKKVYDRMLYAMEKHVRASFSEEEADQDTIDKVFRYVCADHPEVFDVTGYQIGIANQLFGGQIYTFDANYQMEQTQADSLRAQVEQCVDSILAGLDPNADDYTKAKFAYDTIINNTVYDSSAENNQNMLSVYMDGRSVCAGYTAALEYMLQKAGIMCGTIDGTATNNSETDTHAWNIVLLDGACYYIDVTYGDPVGNDDSGYDFGPDYDYFCITTEDLLKNHVIGEDSVAAQECTATDDNYYHREGKFFTSYDRNQLAGLFQDMLASGRKTLSIRCADQGVYDEMYADLISNSGVFDYLPGVNEHGYSASDTFYSMEFAIH
jgi:hypothetical protein